MHDEKMGKVLTLAFLLDEPKTPEVIDKITTLIGEMTGEEVNAFVEYRSKV